MLNRLLQFTSTRTLGIPCVLISCIVTCLAQNPRYSDVLDRANAGDVRAEFMAGMMLVTGDGAAQNIPVGAQWLEKSAKGGIPQAMINLANLYDAGAGVPLDTARAEELRQRAAELGEPTAKGQIADDRRMPGQHDFRRANTLADLKLYNQAFPFAEKAATAGSVNAGLLLGRFYHFGIGVPVNLKEAVRWYRQSADRGLEDGQRHLAYMYEFGLGVQKDRKLALLYYDRSAAQGNALAKHAAANLRSPDYDQPPPAMFGGSSGKSCYLGYYYQSSYLNGGPMCVATDPKNPTSIRLPM